MMAKMSANSKKFWHWRALESTGEHIDPPPVVIYYVPAPI